MLQSGMILQDTVQREVASSLAAPCRPERDSTAVKVIGGVFQVLAEAALKDAAAGAFDDEEEDEGTGKV